MNSLKNAFSVLILDAEGDKQPTLPSASASKDGGDSVPVTSGKGRKKGKESGKRISPKNIVNEKESLSTSSGKRISPKNVVNEKESLSTSSESYKLPLAWIDLEMTGLDVEVDRILEIACVITDGNLRKMVEGPDLVIHQKKACLDNMGKWCQDHHSASGLTKRVLQSTITERDAEKQVMEFVRNHVGTYMPLLAGNSVYVDFSFLKKYMPELASLFSHVLVDVSSVNALCLRWYPREKKRAPSKENKHRALDDIKESINELRYYKENIFKGPKSG